MHFYIQAGTGQDSKPCCLKKPKETKVSPPSRHHISPQRLYHDVRMGMMRSMTSLPDQPSSFSLASSWHVCLSVSRYISLSLLCMFAAPLFLSALCPLCIYAVCSMTMPLLCSLSVCCYSCLCLCSVLFLSLACCVLSLSALCAPSAAGLTR